MFRKLSIVTLLSLIAATAVLSQSTPTPVPVSSFPNASTLTGTEKVPVVQSSQSRKTTPEAFRVYGWSASHSSDVIALWSGTCNSSALLWGDGHCAAPTAIPALPAGTAVSRTADLLTNYSTADSRPEKISPAQLYGAMIASDITTALGTQALVSANIPNNAANTTGNAGTATALAATPTQCSGAANGIAASGNANCASFRSIWSFVQTAAISGATTTYCTPNGVANCSTSGGPGFAGASNRSVPAAFGGTLKNLQIVLATAPGTGNTATFTAYVNGSSTGLTCQVANSATTCADTTDSATFTAGQSLAVQEVTSASASPSQFAGGLEVDTP